MKVTSRFIKLLVEQEIERYQTLGDYEGAREPDAIYDQSGQRVGGKKTPLIDQKVVYYTGNMRVEMKVGEGAHSKNHRFFFDEQQAREYASTSKHARGFEVIKVPFVGSSGSRERIARRKCGFIVAEEEKIEYIGPGSPQEMPIDPAKTLRGTTVETTKEKKQPMKIFERCDEAVAFSGIAAKAAEDRGYPMEEELMNNEGMTYYKITMKIYPVYSIQFEEYEGDNVETYYYLSQIQGRAAAETGCNSNSTYGMMQTIAQVQRSAKQLAAARVRQLGTGSGVTAASMGIGAKKEEPVAVPVSRRKKKTGGNTGGNI